MAHTLTESAVTMGTRVQAQSMESSRNIFWHKSRPKFVYRKLAISVALITAILLWIIDPFPSSSSQSDRITFLHESPEHLLDQFEGHQHCGIVLADLYMPPSAFKADSEKPYPYCKNRATLLQAMSGGGRHGFDATFFPMGCHYRWYSTEEICIILDRFGAIIFVGDGVLQNIYAAFNMLLRENIAMGGLKQWVMTEPDRAACKCDSQIIRWECSKFIVQDSQDVRGNDDGSGHRSPDYCDRASHIFLPINGSPAPDDLHSTFNTILAKDPESYKPIPVIHSLSLGSSFSWPAATSSMDEWVALADAALRNVPFLWVGPNAAGHLKPPGQILSQGNNALWHYTVEMAREADARQLDSLSMYNLTLQATSWDGSGYGLKVALVQAMMVINWLSRLESS